MERMKRLNTIETKEWDPTKDELLEGGDCQGTLQLISGMPDCSITKSEIGLFIDRTFHRHNIL